MDDTLLDAFVGIKPDPNFLDAINTAADQAIAAFTQKFSQARIPFPNLSGGSSGGGVSESLRAAEQAVQNLVQRREASLQRLAALEREIANAQRPSRSQFTASGEERAQRELANIALQRTRIEQELADLLNANRPLTDLSDQAAIQRQILDTSEERVQVERELARLLDQQRVAQSEQARFTGPFRSKFTDEFISTRTTDEDRQAAIAGQESYNQRRAQGAQAAAAAINAAEEGIAARRLRLVEIERDAIITADALAKRRIDLGNQLADITSREAAAAERVSRIREGIGPAEEQRAARLASAQEEQLQLQQQMVTVDQQLNELEQQRLELIRQQATAQGELNDRQQNPPPTPPAPPEDPPAGGGGGRRRRRRGGAGGNEDGGDVPPVPPPPDDGADELALRYRAAADAARDLLTFTQRTKASIAEIGAEGFDIRIQRATNGIRDIQTELTRAGRILSEDVVTRLEADLEAFNRELRTIQAQSYIQRPLRQQFDQEVKTGRANIESGRISAAFEESLGRGQASAQAREQIALMRLQVKQAEIDVRNLSNAFDGTAESVRNLKDANDNLLLKQDFLKGAYRDAQDTSRSLNTLTNNAYQLGQAFEDFAVGFSLNGVAGGVRGAANNVAFLLNNLSQTQGFVDAISDRVVKFKGDIPVKEAQALGEKIARQVPLYAGIGSAVALLIVPVISEWVASLDDVELKLIDIAERIKQTSEDVDFSSGLRQSNAALVDTLRSAGSVRDVIAEIKRLNAESVQGQETITAQFKAFTESGDIGGALKNLKLLKDATRDFIAEQERLSTRIAPIPNFGTVQNVDPFKEQAARKADLERAQELRKVFETTYKAIAAAQNEVLSGGDKQQEKIAQANEEYRKLNETLKELGSKQAFGDIKDLEQVKEQIQAFGTELEKIARKSAEIANIQRNQLPDALQAVVDIADKIGFSLDVAKANVLGLSDDTAAFLSEIQQSNSEFRQMLDLQIQIARAQNVSQELINEANQKATITQFRLQELEIMKEIKKRQEEIDGIEKKRSGRAKFTEFEQFAKDLQVNVLGPEDENRKVVEKNTEEIRRLNEYLSAVRGNRDENLGQLPEDPQRLQRVLGDRQRGLDNQLQQMILPALNPNLVAPASDPLFQVMTQILNAQLDIQKAMLGEQAGTKEAVKKIDTKPRAQ